MKKLQQPLEGTMTNGFLAAGCLGYHGARLIFWCMDISFKVCFSHKSCFVIIDNISKMQKTRPEGE